MTYVARVNELIRAKVSGETGLVCYGQNMTTGSCLSGLTRGLAVPQGSLAVNTQNSENTLTGMGFGVAIRGGKAVYFMKQLDFLLLGLDHLTNSWNVARLGGVSGSFTVFAIVVDSGFEGPQSCLNDLGGLCSLAHIPGYAISSGPAAEVLIDRHLVAPGCRILTVSQRLFGQETPAADEAPEEVLEDGGLLRFGTGTAATLAGFNYSLPQTLDLRDGLRDRGSEAALFSVTAAMAVDWTPIVGHARHSGVLAVIDDGKGENRTSDGLIIAALQAGVRVVDLRRAFDPEELAPNADRFVLPETAAEAVLVA